MKKLIQRNSTAFILILIGMAYLMGATFAGRRGLRLEPDRIVIRDVVEDIRIRPEVIVEEKIVIPPVPAVPPGPAERPLRPYGLYKTTNGIGWIVRTLFQNLLPAVLILVGIWLVVRQRQAPTVPLEKSPSSPDD